MSEAQTEAEGVNAVEDPAVDKKGSSVGVVAFDLLIVWQFSVALQRLFNFVS